MPLACRAFLLSFVLAQVACDGATIATGSVTDSLGGTIVGADIKLRAKAGRRVATTKSDEQGRYKLVLMHSPILAGELEMEVSHVGFVPARVSLPSGGARTMNVTLDPRD